MRLLFSLQHWVHIVSSLFLSGSRGLSLSAGPSISGLMMQKKKHSLTPASLSSSLSRPPTPPRPLDPARLRFQTPASGGSHSLESPLRALLSCSMGRAQRIGETDGNSFGWWDSSWYYIYRLALGEQNKKRQLIRKTLILPTKSLENTENCKEENKNKSPNNYSSLSFCLCKCGCVCLTLLKLYCVWYPGIIFFQVTLWGMPFIS